MNFTITDKNGNKRTIELTEDKEKLGGVDDKLVIIKDGKKYYAPLVEKPSEEKYPRMYVIKKDGIKRYVEEIKKEIPCGYFTDYQMNLCKFKNNKCSMTVYLKVPEEITMLSVHICGLFGNDFRDSPPEFFMKVTPNQLIKFSFIGKYHSGNNNYYIDDIIVNNKNINILDKLNILVELRLTDDLLTYVDMTFSKLVNDYKGEELITGIVIPIIDVRNYPDISEEEYNKNVAFHLKRIDNK